MVIYCESCQTHDKGKKVRCTLVQSLRLCTGCKAPRGSRGVALPFHDHSTRRGWGVNVTPRPLFTTRNDPVSILQKAGWAPGPVLTGAENLASTGIRSRTVKPVASRYTGYATWPTKHTIHCVKKVSFYIWQYITYFPPRSKGCSTVCLLSFFWVTDVWRTLLESK
jgi:hypothetical protein